MRKGGEECEDRDRCTYSLVGRQRTMEAWQDLDDYPFATLGRRSLLASTSTVLASADFRFAAAFSERAFALAALAAAHPYRAGDG